MIGTVLQNNPNTRPPHSHYSNEHSRLLHNMPTLPSIQEEESSSHYQWSLKTKTPSLLLILPLLCALMLMIVTTIDNTPQEVHRKHHHNLESRLADWEEWKIKFHNALIHGGFHDAVVNATEHIFDNITNNDGQEEDSSDLVYLNHSLAYELLLESTNFRRLDADYFLISQGWDSQINQAYCPVASSAAILNSFRGSIDLPMDTLYDPYPFATQHDLWNDCTARKVIRRDDMVDGVLEAPGGLGMDQTRKLLECNLPSNFVVETYHVDPNKISINKMRQDLVSALESLDQRAIVNFNRATVHQVGGGHWSPVGSYSASRDAFLVMDVAKYKYPPVWISARTLYKSLTTKDPCGTWDFPQAQDDLPSNLHHPTTQKEYHEVMERLGCKETRRGYVIVKKT